MVSAKISAMFVLLVAALLSVGYGFFKPLPPIKVGVLHSQTGTMAFSEQPVIAATLAAIDDINAKGGLLGRKVEAVVVDGASDDRTFASQAKYLLVDQKVSVIFGGWTSASRKAMLPIIENYRGLLFYPVQYEGIEQSENVIYMGPTANQQLYPAVSWILSNLGKKVFIVGSDYIYPRMSSSIASKLIKRLNGQVCGSVFLPLGSKDVASMINAVSDCKPDVILNFINGDTNIAFFKGLQTASIETPVMSLSIAEPEIQSISQVVGERVLLNHYVVSDYFQSLESPGSTLMKHYLSERSPNVQMLSSAMKAAWDGVHLWAKAVEMSKTEQTALVSRNLPGLSMIGMSSAVSVDLENRHVWQKFFVGKVQQDGQFMVVWQSQLPVQPKPWPDGEVKNDWLKEMQQWYRHWGNRWQAAS